MSFYLGGSAGDAGLAISLGAAGALATIAGVTGSADFPTTPGAFDTSYNGGTSDGFVTQVEAAFDFCIQDDSTRSVLLINSTTGEYQFNNCAGVIITGVGTIMRNGATISLQHFASTHSVVAQIDFGARRGSAGIRSFSLGRNFTITDRDTTNNTCKCP